MFDFLGFTKGKPTDIWKGEPLQSRVKSAS